MKVTWLGGSGLLFENNGVKVLVDPYLSDSLATSGKTRLIPIDEQYFDIIPDVIIITHSHPGHMDLDTLKKYLLRDKCITVLAAESAYAEIVKLGGNNNYVLLSPHSVWNEKGITFYSVKAEHSDRCAIGVILDDQDMTYYVTGDTLYNFDVIDDCLDLAPDGVDYVFLPINGRDNNMNARDAADFAYEIGAKRAVPVHYGLFDSVCVDDFDFDDALVLTPYVAYELD